MPEAQSVLSTREIAIDVAVKPLLGSGMVGKHRLPPK